MKKIFFIILLLSLQIFTAPIIRIDSIIPNHGRYQDTIKVYRTISSIYVCKLDYYLNYRFVSSFYNKDSSYNKIVVIDYYGKKYFTCYIDHGPVFSCDFHDTIVDTAHSFTYDTVRIDSMQKYKGKYLDTMRMYGYNLNASHNKLYVFGKVIIPTSKTSSLLRFKIPLGYNDSTPIVITDGNERDSIFFKYTGTVVNAFDMLFRNWWSVLKNFWK